MVEATDTLELRVILSGVFADCRLPGEVVWRSGYRGNFAGGDHRSVDRRVVVGIKGQTLIEDGTAALAGDIEVGVIGQIDDGGLVGVGAIFDPNNVAMKGVTDISAESAGESLVAIRADESEFDATGDQLCLPVAAIEAFATAVECVHAFVVESSLENLPVQLDVALCNAVGVATNGGAEVSILVIHVGIERTITECEIAEPPFAVLCLEGDNPSTEGNDPELNVRGVEGLARQ